jgi:murein DD-endopeptidase MepM/ murein hydrolase activator NlpD
MGANRTFRLRGRLRRAFRRREIFLRGEDRIRYIAISPAVQVAAALLALTMVLLTAFGLLGTALYRDAASSREDVLAELRAEYWTLLQTLDALSESVADAEANRAGTSGALVRNMVRKEMDRFRGLFPDGAGSGGDPLADRLTRHSVPDGLLLADAHSRRLARAQEAEREVARLIAREEQLIDDLADASGMVSASESERIELAETVDAMSVRIGTLETQLAAAEERSGGLSATLLATRFELERELDRRLAAETERKTFAAEASRLQGQIATYQSAQASWLLALGARTQDSIALVESAVAMTGVDVDMLLSRAQKELRTASGGPFVAAAVGEVLSLPDGVDTIAIDVGEQVERWEALKRVVRVMPFSAPLDQYQIASGFGTRSDPINGRRAMHTGLDFNAPVKTPVLSTAPGRVVFAGWHGEYGRLVEIDHGFGIRTRYAHLAEISVEKDEEVPNRAKVGLLGSSGRSTGPHLHYEVLVDGRPLNPKKFLEAARHVLKD